MHGVTENFKSVAAENKAQGGPPRCDPGQGHQGHDTDPAPSTPVPSPSLAQRAWPPSLLITGDPGNQKSDVRIPLLQLSSGGDTATQGPRNTVTSDGSDCAVGGGGLGRRMLDRVVGKAPLRSWHVGPADEEGRGVKAGSPQSRDWRRKPPPWVCPMERRSCPHTRLHRVPGRAQTPTVASPGAGQSVRRKHCSWIRQTGRQQSENIWFIRVSYGVHRSFNSSKLVTR